MLCSQVYVHKVCAMQVEKEGMMRLHGRSQRLRQRTAWSLLAVAALFGAMLTAWVAAPASAATGFATPAFQTQWTAGETVTPNFWGPLSLARDGQQEPYVEAPGGQRLVQYFDKARMELTNPTTGTVTNGLLATELITGRLQLGDNSFDPRQPAGVPVAGDPDNIGPTYASINLNAATLITGTTTTPGAPTTRSLGATGTLGVYTGAADPQANIAAYDADTQHNVPAAFSNYRTKVGLLSIGFGISEPFWSNVKVAGVAEGRPRAGVPAAHPHLYSLEPGCLQGRVRQHRSALLHLALPSAEHEPHADRLPDAIDYGGYVRTEVHRRAGNALSDTELLRRHLADERARVE